MIKPNNSKPLVSAKWLHENLNNPDLVILEASLPKPNSNPSHKSEPIKIKGARIFDIEKNFSDKNTTLPHMMPSEKVFTDEARKLGVNKNSIIVVYDNIGIYSAPRAWWMFRAMGHNNVYVLDGGLPEWIKAGYETENIGIQNNSQGNFEAHYKPELIKDYKEVLNAINDKSKVIIDARSHERFIGAAPEPRAGLRPGHIPNAKNIPFPDILNDTLMKNESELKDIYHKVADENQELIFSCGSGVTACIIALGAELAGYQSISVYDGSWSEWGLPSDLPVTTE